MSQAALIAVVDDDADVRSALSSLLAALGRRCQAYASGDAFLAAKESREAGCVIADIHMPGLTGIEVLERLVGQGGAPPFIFITAYPDEASRARALKAGAVGYLAKPFRTEALAACLEDALGPA